MSRSNTYDKNNVTINIYNNVSDKKPKKVNNGEKKNTKSSDNTN